MPRPSYSIVRFAGCLFGLATMLAGCGRTDAPADGANVESGGKPEATAPGTTPAAAPIDPQRDLFSTFGISLRRPVGWKVEQAVQPAGIVGRWLPAQASDDDWSQFSMDVDVLSGPIPSLRAAAERAVAMLPNKNRRYRYNALTIDGVKAMRAVPDKLGRQPEEGPPVVGPLIVAVRDGVLVKLLFLLDDPREIKLAREVTRSIRWTDRLPLFSQISQGPVTEVFDGRGRIRLPRQARFDPTLARAGILSYVAFDYVGMQDGLAMAMELHSVPDTTLAQQAIAYAELIESNTRLEGLLQFAKEDDNSIVWSSEFLVGRFPDGKGNTVQRHSRYAVWELAPGEFVHLQFVVNDEVVNGEVENGAAAAAIDQILASCKSVER